MPERTSTQISAAGRGKPLGMRRSRLPSSLRVALPLALALVLALAPGAEASSSVITRGPIDRATVALTFDDGWGFQACERVVRVLRRTGTPATFFVNGVYVARDPDRWRKLLDGFTVANHTRTHVWLTRSSDRQVRDEILGNQRYLEGITGRPMLKALRPPYGAYDDRVLRLAGDLGYRWTALWDRSSADTSPAATTATVLRNATRGGAGSIILMHCGPEATANALPAIIASYRTRGYRLVGLEEMLRR